MISGRFLSFPQVSTIGRRWIIGERWIFRHLSSCPPLRNGPRCFPGPMKLKYCLTICPFLGGNPSTCKPCELTAAQHLRRYAPFLLRFRRFGGVLCNIRYFPYLCTVTAFYGVVIKFVHPAAFRRCGFFFFFPPEWPEFAQLSERRGVGRIWNTPTEQAADVYAIHSQGLNLVTPQRAKSY